MNWDSCDTLIERVADLDTTPQKAGIVANALVSMLPMSDAAKAVVRRAAMREFWVRNFPTLCKHSDSFIPGARLELSDIEFMMQDTEC